MFQFSHAASTGLAARNRENTMAQPTDKIRRPIAVGDTVDRGFGLRGTVEIILGTRVGVRLPDGSTAVWYADQTMLVSKEA